MERPHSNDRSVGSGDEPPSAVRGLSNHSTDMTDPTASTPVSLRRPKWQVFGVLIPIVAVLIAGYIAGASWAKLLNTHPLVLIGLSPINRYLLLTSNSLDWWTYYSVGLIRHLLPDPFFYLVGSWYGARAIHWAGETYPMVKKLTGEDGTGLSDPSSRKIIYPLAFIMPNNWVSLLCGASSIPFGTFAVLNISGTLTRLFICRWIASLFESEIRSIAEWVGRYAWPITAVSIVVVGLGIAFQFRRGSGEIVGLVHLDEIEPE
jgi:hypothetical protein